ncbi:MAG: hypothetical protein Q9181_003919 [Wetmoreana brouardii]
MDVEVSYTTHTDPAMDVSDQRTVRRRDSFFRVLDRFVKGAFKEVVAEDEIVGE